MNTYYITNEQNETKIDLTPITTNCSCGESVGYVKDDDKIIVCDACYEASSFKERLW
jgi:hypothetical protein